MRSSIRPATVYDFPDRTSNPRPSVEHSYNQKQSPKGGRHTLDEMLLGTTPVPTWLQQFSRGSNARFTRTPDYLLKARNPQPPAPALPEAALQVEADDHIQPDIFSSLDHSAAIDPVEDAGIDAQALIERLDRLVAMDWQENPAVTMVETPEASLLLQPEPDRIIDQPAPWATSEAQPSAEPADFPSLDVTGTEPAPLSLNFQASLSWSAFGMAASWAPTISPAPVAHEQEADAAATAAISVTMDEAVEQPTHIPTPQMTFASIPAPAVPLARAAVVPPTPRRPMHQPPLVEAYRAPAPVAEPTPAPAPVVTTPAAELELPVAEAPLAPAIVAATIEPELEPELQPAPMTTQIEAETTAPFAPWLAPTAIARALHPVAPVVSLVGFVANDDFAAAPVITEDGQGEAAVADDDDATDCYRLPPLSLLTEPPQTEPCYELSAEYLDSMSEKLQRTLRDFGVKGEIMDANPGPVVTLYELEPAPGTKLSRVVSVSSDIARSMSAVSTRVAVVEGRNIIGIELPNQRRETVWLRELMSSPEFTDSKAKLPLCLGKTIGGAPIIADLARMPHLLVAGTTGSGKSVSINTMILSLLYKLRPEECRLIMIDPKMLELSVYEGIPHLLTPVVTDPKKAVVALKWAVREMEERYRKMAHLGVRNIDGFNARLEEAREKGEVILRHVQTGFDRENGEPIFEEQEMDLTSLPYIVVIVDEMADLMMVAGKDIEGAIQRLAQMARAAGIHIIMATQRPSVDVITGTIKANFPTRISFQVTSKIDSRTILGEMGAEQLLGQGDMLYMTGGGRITRVHGPFVSDQEVEHIVDHLKDQGRPEYLDEVTCDEDDEAAAASAAAAPEEDTAVFDSGAFAEEGGELYEQAVAIVLRDRKASTSYIQRRLKIGYNRAASIMERMETEHIVGPANHAGKRDILTHSRNH